MNAKLRKTIIIICTVVSIFCISGLGYFFVLQYLEDQVDKQVAGLVSETPYLTPAPTPEATVTPMPEVLEKYAALYAQNPDTIGWLKIDGTAIDYPVMFTPDDPDKYLHIDFYGNTSNRGTLYLDENCDIWNSENLIIYGHHMQSSAMFGNLDYFSSESYWEDHKYITFDTIYKEQTYEVVAAFYARILYKDEEGFRYYQFIEAEDKDAFNAYADFIEANRCYDTGVDIAYGDRLLTLSTCAYQVENGRFAVVAKLIEDDEESPAPSAVSAAGINDSLDASAAPNDTVFIEDEAVPISDSPSERSQSFSTNLTFLALCLVLFGTGLIAAFGKRHTI